MTAEWSLFTNHGLVLVTLARTPDLRLRDLAASVGITERAAQAIVNDLVTAGYVERIREGRRNRYLVRGDRPLRSAAAGEGEVARLLGAVTRGPDARPAGASRVAAALACSDSRYQEPLRSLLATEGLLGRAELFLWPGGSAALGGADGPRILETMASVLDEGGVSRVVLVAHQGCRVRGAHIARRQDAIETWRAVIARRRRSVERVRRMFGVEPELWFLTERGARRAKSRREFHGLGQWQGVERSAS